MRFTKAVLLSASIFAISINRAEAAEPPNIVFILVDDVGWKDVGYNNAPMCETPQIDRLASQGMRFRQAYAPAPICSASRAAILTGQSPARLNFEFVTKYRDTPLETRQFPLLPPPFTLNLALEKQTVPEALHSAGYQSGFFGKWHVSAHKEAYLSWSDTHGPRQQGFDVAEEDFGGHPYTKVPDKERRRLARLLTQGNYPDDSMTDRAIRFLQQHRRQQPFYLQVNHFYAHTPVKTQADWLTEKYKSRLPADRPTRHAEYAAFVEILDHHVGRLLTALDELELAENTLVVFFSDNGGDPRFTQHAPLRGHKWTLYEGGIRVPMVVRWPGVVEPGSASDVPVIGTDLMPTFVEVAGLEQDASIPLDGQSLLTLLSGRDDRGLTGRDLIWHFPYYHPEKIEEDADRTVKMNASTVPFLEPHSALRRGSYKLLRFYESQRIELYDLASDISELQDLSQTQTDLANELATGLQQSLEAVNARFPK